MPAESKSQQRLMSMALAYKHGNLDTSRLDEDLILKLKKLSESMTEEQLKDFTKVASPLYLLSRLCL